MSQSTQYMAPQSHCKTAPLIKQRWLDSLDQTRFLSRCRSGEISREELQVFLRQHQIYSRCFTRYLAALLTNIDNDDHRFELTRNLFDEMGLGEAGDIPHSQLYREMMHSMGVMPDQTPLPGTRHLMDTMYECCKSPSHMVGLGALCLGAEGIVPHIYRQIVEGFLAVGESLSNLLFFTLHIECDDNHAATMYKIIDQDLQKHPAAEIDLNYGAEKLIRARIGFFEGLSAQATANSI